MTVEVSAETRIRACEEEGQRGREVSRVRVGESKDQPV